MMLVGIDDTDLPGTPGTNQLARAIVRELGARWRLRSIARHQLLFDPRVPYTSKNGSASIALDRVEPRTSSAARGDRIDTDARELAAVCRRVMRSWHLPGSDPGLCVAAADAVPPEATRFGERCQAELVTIDDARALAARCGLLLEELGGTGGGIIGALAAVGLARKGDDGRIIQWREWPDDLSGPQPVSKVTGRGVVVQDEASGDRIEQGIVDVGKHLRPSLRQGGAVLFVAAVPGIQDWFVARKLP